VLTRFSVTVSGIPAATPVAPLKLERTSLRTMPLISSAFSAVVPVGGVGAVGLGGMTEQLDDVVVVVVVVVVPVPVVDPVVVVVPVPLADELVVVVSSLLPPQAEHRQRGGRAGAGEPGQRAAALQQRRIQRAQVVAEAEVVVIVIVIRAGHGASSALFSSEGIVPRPCIDHCAGMYQR